MFRIVRTSTLAALRADSTALPVALRDLDQARAEAEAANDSAIRAETVAEDQLRQLARLHADRAQEEAATRAELDAIRTDVARLRDAAADPETGDSFRQALAYGVLRDLIADARARGVELGRPFDLVASLLGFDDPDAPQTEPQG